MSSSLNVFVFLWGPLFLCFCHSFLFVSVCPLLRRRHTSKMYWRTTLGSVGCPRTRVVSGDNQYEQTKRKAGPQMASMKSATLTTLTRRCGRDPLFSKCNSISATSVFPSPGGGYVVVRTLSFCCSLFSAAVMLPYCVCRVASPEMVTERCPFL